MRDLGRGFKERQPVASRLVAVPAVLGLEHFHRAGDGNIAEPLESPSLRPGSDDAAARAAW
jgi:hypothetical protein